MIKKIINQIMRKVSMGVFLLALSLMITEGFSGMKPIKSFSLDFKKKNENPNIVIKGTLKKGSLFFKKVETGWPRIIDLRVPADGKTRTLKIKYEVIKKGDEGSKLIINVRGLKNNKGKGIPSIVGIEVKKVGPGTFKKSVVFKKDSNLDVYQISLVIGNGKALGMQVLIDSISLK